MKTILICANFDFVFLFFNQMSNFKQKCNGNFDFMIKIYKKISGKIKLNIKSQH